MVISSGLPSLSHRSTLYERCLLLSLAPGTFELHSVATINRNSHRKIKAGRVRYDRRILAKLRSEKISYCLRSCFSCRQPAVCDAAALCFDPIGACIIGKSSIENFQTGLPFRP